MSLDFNKLLNTYFIRPSFINEVINNNLRLMQDLKGVNEGENKVKYLLKNHNCMPAQNLDLFYFRLYDFRNFLTESDSIEVTPRSFIVQNQEVNFDMAEVSSKSVCIKNLDKLNTIFDESNIYRFYYRFQISPERMDTLKELKEEVKPEQIRAMMFCVFLRAVGLISVGFDKLFWQDYLHLSEREYCELIYEVLDQKNREVYFKGLQVTPLAYTDYRYFILYQMKQFFKTNDAYYLIKAASAKAQISDSPLIKDLTHLYYKIRYLYF